MRILPLRSDKTPRSEHFSIFSILPAEVQMSPFLIRQPAAATVPPGEGAQSACGGPAHSLILISTALIRDS